MEKNVLGIMTVHVQYSFLFAYQRRYNHNKLKYKLANNGRNGVVRLSKIDDYKKVKFICDTVEEKLNCAMVFDKGGKADTRNDKHVLRISYTGKRTNGYCQDAIMQLHASYGIMVLLRDILL